MLGRHEYLFESEDNVNIEQLEYELREKIGRATKHNIGSRYSRKYDSEDGWTTYIDVEYLSPVPFLHYRINKNKKPITFDIISHKYGIDSFRGGKVELEKDKTFTDLSRDEFVKKAIELINNPVMTNVDVGQLKKSRKRKI